MNETRFDLADKLEQLTALIDQHPSSIIGEKITVSSYGNSGPVIGSHVSVSVGPGQTGPVIGKSISVTAGGPNPADISLKSELKSIASDLRTPEGSVSQNKQRIINVLSTAGSICQEVAGKFAHGLGEGIGKGAFGG